MQNKDSYQNIKFQTCLNMKFKTNLNTTKFTMGQCETKFAVPEFAIFFITNYSLLQIYHFFQLRIISNIQINNI